MEATSKETADVFKRLGLTKYEISILLALIANEGSPMDYRDLLADTDVPYGRVHSVLLRLEEKGLVTGIGGRPKRYAAKPIGAMIEDYITTPVLESLIAAQNSPDNQFRDVWIKQVSSHVPVIRVDEVNGGAELEFITGVDNLRRREYDEAQKARNSLHLCLPASAFLDRRRSVPLRIGDDVRTEIITSLSPKQFLHRMPSDERARWQQTVTGNGDLMRTAYYSHPKVNERMLIVDGRFASIGTSLIPVTAHIYSKSMCKALLERFEALKQGAKKIYLGAASYS